MLLLSAGLAQAQPVQPPPYLPPPPTPQPVGVEQPMPVPSGLEPSQPEINRPRPAPAEPLPEPMPVPIPIRVPGRFWVDADYLVWWFKDAIMPAVLTTGSSSGLLPGVLGDPTTVVLFGNDNLDYGAFSGGRFTAGVWFNAPRTIGLEARGFGSERRFVDFATRSDSGGNFILAQPFFDPTIGSETAAPIAFPGLATGGFSAASSLVLWGGEANLLWNLAEESWMRGDFLAGFQYLELREGLEMNSDYGPLAGNTMPFNGGSVAFPTIIQVHDSFRTQNQFYGGQFGGRVNFAFERLDVNLLAKLALGTTHQTLDIAGLSTTQPGPGAAVAQSVAGGLYAQATNSGRFVRDVFTAVPSFECKLGWWLTRTIRLQAGYSFLFWSAVTRPGAQIDHRVNPNQVPTFSTFTPGTPFPPFPSQSFNRTDSFWVQGFSFGLEFRY